ncbi:V-type ATP synthase subunit E [uncultured Intestinimonas sp.]|uniref:V-type ATP synthase subunit E n=1 Tax=uncultured Intestinimonas sp. TaxID=1689265 RepID=UPI002609FE85|nr:V-type ATP synthase subunit E family protein [uncultured Intestinimonas sp.]
MNGIEKITGQIAVDAQKEIDALLQQARDQAAQTAAGYEAQAASQSQAILERGEQEARRRKERLIDGARMEGRRAVLQTKQELVGRAFDLALEKLTGLPEEEYIALLARLAAAAARTGREQVILSQKDRSRYGKQVVTQANELLAREVAPKPPEGPAPPGGGPVVERVVPRPPAVVAATGRPPPPEEARPMAGGLILRDGRVETNCSFEALIHLQREALAAQVAKVLFP